MGPLDRNPAYVAGFLLLLALPQLAAQVEQLRLGYRPFGRAPGRVALSWDMFATAISRCDVRWDPPLDVGRGKRLGRLHDAGTALEWDAVYDRVEDYVVAARYGCNFALPDTTVALTCFTSEGRTLHDAFRCR